MTKPKICPLEIAQKWTNNKNPGSRYPSKWDWGLLCDIAYVTGSNPGTIIQNVKRLLKVLV